jgi:hypothetical protein
MCLICSGKVILLTYGVAAKDGDAGQPNGNRDCIQVAENNICC